MPSTKKECLTAFKKGHKEKAENLLRQLEHPSEVKTEYDVTLLHYAAQWGWADTCEELIDHFDLSAIVEDHWEHKPLHHASMYGSAKVVSYLLTLDAVSGTETVPGTLNDEDVHGHTALRLAEIYHYPEVVDLLAGAPPVLMLSEYLSTNNVAILSMLSRRINPNIQFTIKPCFRVFMAGNHASGKTSLKTVMLNLAEFRPFRHRDLGYGVKTLTAAGCPAPCSG